MGIKLLIKKIFALIFPPKKIVANIVSLAQTDLLNGKTALITGGTSGIGKAIAVAFLNAGADVIITGRNIKKTQHTAEELSQKYPQRQVFGIDLDNTKVETFQTKLSDIQQLIGERHIEILVNNAGVNSSSGYNCNEKDYDMILDTNLKGVFFLSRTIAEYMIANNIQGNILNIASSSSLRPATKPYSLSKWALKGLTIGFAKKLIKYGIVVNGLAPGPTFTPMLVKDGVDNISLVNNPSGRFAMPEEIANMAVVLVSGLGRMIVGDIIYITGGAGTITIDDINY